MLTELLHHLDGYVVRLGASILQAVDVSAVCPGGTSKLQVTRATIVERNCSAAACELYWSLLGSW